jgi:hypothetical protein
MLTDMPLLLLSRIKDNLVFWLILSNTMLLKTDAEQNWTTNNPEQHYIIQCGISAALSANKHSYNTGLHFCLFTIIKYYRTYQHRTHWDLHDL